MPLPTYTMYANRPRIWVRDTDLAMYQARVADGSGWGPYWGGVKDEADDKANDSASSLADNSAIDDWSFILGFYGWVSGGGGRNQYLDKLIDVGMEIASRSDGDDPSLRKRVQALATIFDFGYNVMSNNERDTIGAEIIQQIDRLSDGIFDRIAGTASIENTLRFFGAATVHGHSGLTNDATDEIEHAVEFYYGEPEATRGARTFIRSPQGGRLDEARFFNADGCSTKGGRYATREGYWPYGWFLWAMKNATDLDVWTDEAAWLSRAWEGLIWQGYRGDSDRDFEHLHDTGRSTIPFHEQHQWMWGAISELYPNPNGTQGGRHLRYVWDQMEGEQTLSDRAQAWNVLFFDRANNTGIHPKDGSPVPANSRLFDPPGFYYYRESPSGFDDWDYNQSVLFRIACRKWFIMSHTHHNCGSVMIRFRHDPLLLAPSGIYDDFSTPHSINFYQRSWSQSMVPLVHDPSQDFRRYGSAVLNDGGQHYKKVAFREDTGEGESRPHTIHQMLNEEGGEAWKLSDQFEIVEEAATHAFIVADFKKAYVKFFDDANRLMNCVVKYLVIKPTAGNGLTYPALLYYARLNKADSTWETTIPFHFAQTITTTAYGFHAESFRNVGKLWVDVRNIGQYTLTNNPPGSPDPTNADYGEDQFTFLGAGGTNHLPNRDPKNNGREDPTLKTDSLYLSKTAQSMEEHYVCLLMPTAAADAEPAQTRRWVTDAEEPDYYGIEIGGDTYLVHRTQDIVVIGDPGNPPEPDTTPPAEVTSLVASARDGGLQVSWDDPADVDLAKVKVYYRTAAT